MTIFANLANLQWQQVVMWAIGALLIYLAIKKEMEPALLLPMDKSKQSHLRPKQNITNIFERKRRL